MARKRRRSPRRSARAQPKPTAKTSPTLAVVPEVAPVGVAQKPVIAVIPVSDEVSPRHEPAEPIAVQQLRVLAVFPDTSVLRLIRENIGAFTEAVADTTPDAGFGFEMAMQRDYEMFFLGVEMPVLDGERLYDFITKAYINARPLPRKVPGVVYIAHSGSGDVPQELKRDARVKGVLTCPLGIARLLRTTEGTLPAKEVGR